MQLPDDDELYEVDQTYLGPPGRYIAPMRHKAIFAFLVTAPLVFVVVRQLGIPLTLLTGGLLFIGSVWAAVAIADRATNERPVLSLATSWWHDLTAPRQRRVRHRATGDTYARLRRRRTETEKGG